MILSSVFYHKYTKIIPNHFDFPNETNQAGILETHDLVRRCLDVSSSNHRLWRFYSKLGILEPTIAESYLIMPNRLAICPRIIHVNPCKIRRLPLNEKAIKFSASTTQIWYIRWYIRTRKRRMTEVLCNKVSPCKPSDGLENRAQNPARFIIITIWLCQNSETGKWP